VASPSPLVTKPGRALTLGIAWLVLLLALFCAALLAAGPTGATPSTTSASGQSLFALRAVQQADLTAADGVWGSYFGYSVAIDGDTAAVGAYGDAVGGNFDQGSVYVFTRIGTTWTQQAKLTASDGAANFEFGSSVAISGNTIVVGSVAAGAVGDAYQGFVYVFTRDGTIWTQQQKLTASDGAFGDQFGCSVAISGDTVVAGAAADAVGANSEQGSAYVFTRDGTIWSQQAHLIANDGAAHDFFGCSVAISGDSAAIGSSWGSAGGAGHGAAYIFTRSGSTWTPQAELAAPDGDHGDEFGCSVAISADTVVAGAKAHYVGPWSRGAVYVFTRSGTTWTKQAELTAADGIAGASFGDSVAISGDTAVAGAQYQEFGSILNRGSAYIFARSGSTWSQQAELTAANGAEDDWFGCSVSLSDSTAVAGAYFKTINGTDRQGSAYIFTLNPCPPSKPSISKISPTKGKVGITVTIAGKYFGAKRGTSKVLCGTKAVTRYVSWNATKIRIRVPAIIKGRRALRVVTAAGKSNAKYFTRL
jgi:FG-GAP repeat/IPT/TIG domain